MRDEKRKKAQDQTRSYLCAVGAWEIPVALDLSVLTEYAGKNARRF